MVRRIVTSWVSSPVLRSLLIFGFDAVATVCAFWAALILRFEGGRLSSTEFTRPAMFAVPILVAARLLSIRMARLHRWSFKMSGLAEAVRLGMAMAGGSVLFLLVFWPIAPWALQLPEGAYPLPRAVIVLEFFLSSSLMGGFRFVPRLAIAWRAEQLRKSTGSRTIIVGAGNAGDLLARDIIRSQESRYWVVGFVDDDPTKLRAFVAGKPVLGKIQDLPRIIGDNEIETVLLAITRLPAERIRQVLDMCGRSKARFKIIPASFSYLDERISAAMLHDLSPEDLLPRDAVSFDAEEIRTVVRERRALVTGAGGSIGGEICRQLAGHGVKLLVMVDINENELYLGARRLQHSFPALTIQAEVADIREPSRLQRLAAHYRPEHVFHAAAHKHVPLMEDAPEEAVKNNVFGTLNVARMAHECHAERLVVISTDKAVKPTSIMGATKRIAELVVRDLAQTSRTKMTAVRFGNVLGSAGSVVPIFKEQIERGGPVTVTHPDCTRYFMTIPEAVGLVLLAGLGGYGELCVLDMGEPIRIVDLARNLITMAGRVPGDEIDIVYTGLRPGEKLCEELLTEEEEETHQVRSQILIAKSPLPPADLPHRLRELRELSEMGDRAGLIRAIQHLVPTYRQTPDPAKIPCGPVAVV